MPRIRRHQLPQPLLVHLLTRIREQKLSSEPIILLARWLDTEPEAPDGKWFRKFSGFTVWGEGAFKKTFLLPGQG